MIDFLRGTVVHREPEYVVLDVRGVGYRVFCANPYAVGAGTKDNEETTLFIHYQVREDAHHLFGFQTRDEQSLFRRLLEVSGIGPKVAIGILNGGKPEVIAAAIQQENVAFLTKLPGVGKKTAQRIVLDLKDKLAAYAGAAAGLESGLLLMGEAGGLPGGGAAGTGVWSEAKQALLALGYTEAEADRAGHSVKAKIKETDSVDAVIKLALQALFQGV